MIGIAGSNGLAASLRCKCWNCTECSADNKARLYGLILTLAPTLVVTLTSNPHWFSSPSERAQRLAAAWQVIRRRLRRRYAGAFDFVAVFEATLRGEPHLHIALKANNLRAKMLQSLLSAWMQELMGAPVVRVQSSNAGTAGYLSKGPFHFSGRRRFWTSRGWRIRAKAVQFAAVVHAILKSPLHLVELWVASRRVRIVERSKSHFKTSGPFSDLSIGVQTGPPIGAQKGPPFTMAQG